MAKKRSRALVDEFKNLPFATLTIITANVIVYLLTRARMEDAVMDYGLIPSQLRIGKMLTSTFLHDGVVHLSTNMALLYIFGRDIERAMGKLEYVMFYIGACVASSVLHVAIVFAALPPFCETRAIIGASGAVAGVMGIYAVRFHRKSFRFGEIRVPPLLLIMAWLIIQIVLGIRGLYQDAVVIERIGYWSHLGGFAFGLMIALFTNMALSGEREHLLSEARRHYDDGSLLEAAQNYELLLKYDPENAFAHAELGRLWGILEEQEQSVPCYQAAVEFYLAGGQEEQALVAAEEMRKFWPDAQLSAPTRFRLASYLEEAGYPRRAIQAFQRIVDSDGTCVEAQMSLLKIGQLQLSSLDDPAAAITTLRGLLDRYPDTEWRTFVEQTLARAEEAAGQST